MWIAVWQSFLKQSRTGRGRLNLELVMKFVAFERSMQGTGASRRLRNSGKTPGIVYGGVDQQPQLVELDHNALWHALKKEAFHASILDMELNGKETKVLLRDFQMHPYKQLVLHIDFQRVDAKTTLNRKVPFHYSGEETSPAVKVDACLINHVMNRWKLPACQLICQKPSTLICLV